MADFVELSVDDLWPGDRVPAPIFVDTETGKERAWEAGEVLSAMQLAAWKSASRRLFIDGERLSALARFMENQLAQIEPGSSEWLSRFALAISSRLRLLSQSPERPGLLLGVYGLAEIQSRFGRPTLEGLMSRQTLRLVDQDIYRQILTAGLVAVLGQGLGSIKELSAVVYAAYVADVGRLLEPASAAPPLSNAMSGQVVMSILAKHHPVSLETHQAIIGFGERLDGSGVPYGCGPASIPIAARCLGLARFLVEQLPNPFVDMKDFQLVLHNRADDLARWYDVSLVTKFSNSVD